MIKTINRFVDWLTGRKPASSIKVGNLRVGGNGGHGLRVGGQVMRCPNCGESGDLEFSFLSVIGDRPAVSIGKCNACGHEWNAP
jgi:hypothetical protein